MSSKKSGKLSRNQRQRQTLEKSSSFGPTCSCGHTARRQSDRFCTSCGSSLSAVKSVSPYITKAVGVTRAALVKAVRVAVDQEIDRSGVRGKVDGLPGKVNGLRGALNSMDAQIAANERRLDELTEMAVAYLPVMPGTTKSASPAPDMDPYANLTIDGFPVQHDPLMERELLSHDPARREAAFKSRYGRRS